MVVLRRQPLLLLRTGSNEARRSQVDKALREHLFRACGPVSHKILTQLKEIKPDWELHDWLDLLTQRLHGNAHPLLNERRHWLLPAVADFECKHGRLAGDDTKPCGCWEGE